MRWLSLLWLSTIPAVELSGPARRRRQACQTNIMRTSQRLRRHRIPTSLIKELRRQSNPRPRRPISRFDHEKPPADSVGR
jgi:hypothetical protein